MTNEPENQNEEDINLDESEADESVVAEEALGDTIKKLREKLKKSDSEKKEYLDGWQRAQADYANLKKNTEFSKAEFAQFYEERLIRELIPAMQSFQSAFSNKEAWEKVDVNWRTGVEYIYSQFLTALEQGGVTLIDPELGSAFDPVQHASVESVPVSSAEEDHTVQMCIQKGFSLRGKILEPAKVKVGNYADKN